MLLLILGAWVGLAVVLEVVNFVARGILAGGSRVEALRAEIRKTQQDLADAANKMDALKGELRQAFNDLDRSKSNFESTEKEIVRRQKTDPVLVYLLGPEVGSGYRFRAPVTKILPEKPDPNQTLLWSKENFVEIWATTEEKARSFAPEPFSPTHTYTVGPFLRTGDEEVVGQAA